MYLEISVVHDPEAMRRRTDVRHVQTVRKIISPCRPDSATIDVHDGISIGLKTKQYRGTPRLISASCPDLVLIAVNPFVPHLRAHTDV